MNVLFVQFVPPPVHVARCPPDESSATAAQKRVLAGRTNFQKSLDDKDYPIIRSIRGLMQKRPTKVIKDVAELANGSSDLLRPYSIKKGRGLLKAFLSNDDARGRFEATLNDFRAQLMNGSSDKQVIIINSHEDANAAQITSMLSEKATLDLTLLRLLRWTLGSGAGTLDYCKLRLNPALVAMGN